MRKRGRKAKCPYCGSGRTISKGVRRTVTLGNRPLRECRECRRRFTVGRIVHTPVLSGERSAPRMIPI